MFYIYKVTFARQIIPGLQ